MTPDTARVSSTPRENLPPDVRAVPVDAFILYNVQELRVSPIVDALERAGLSTHFYPRDSGAPGVPAREYEDRRFRAARNIVVVLGAAGWGPLQREIAQSLVGSQRPIFVVIVSSPPEEAEAFARKVFGRLQWLDLRGDFNAGIADLARALTGGTSTRPKGPNDPIVEIIRRITVSDDVERVECIEEVRRDGSLDRAALAERLRGEIDGRFLAPPLNVDERKRAIVRGWLISLLVWIDNASPDSRDVLRRHADPTYEESAVVRFWTLAGCWKSEAPITEAITLRAADDPDPTVRRLATVLMMPRMEAVEALEQDLASKAEARVYAAASTLRVYSAPVLSPALWRLTEGRNERVAIAALRALANPQSLGEVSAVLLEQPGIEQVVQRIARVAGFSPRSAVHFYALLLAQMDVEAVDRALAALASVPAFAAGATALAERLDAVRGRSSSPQFVASYNSDTIELGTEALDITDDVQTLTAVMLSREVMPPLAIGLFGDWGTGKSYFMKSMQAAAERYAASRRPDGSTAFCTDIVQIEFNAWHYTDRSLWASLGSFILKTLRSRVSPETTPEGQQRAVLLQIAEAQAEVARVDQSESQTRAALEQIEARLQAMVDARKAGDAALKNLTATQAAQLLSPEQRDGLQRALRAMGISDAVESIEDIRAILEEGKGLAAQMQMLFRSSMPSVSSSHLAWLVLGATFAGALLVYAANAAFHSAWWAPVSAMLAEFTAVAALVRKRLRDGLKNARQHLQYLEDAKQRAAHVLEAQKSIPSPQEQELEQQCKSLRQKMVDDASARALAIQRKNGAEQQLALLRNQDTLAGFLDRRLSSDDYAKHLGIVSVIREDFEQLTRHIAQVQGGTDQSFSRVERIILYIDDLDRCPPEKVMEVLQAVHLLLAYPLFVVVVGVDPRWLLHSLRATNSAFNQGASQNDSDRWLTTPQNYLEKIFQIPFSLRPMNQVGYAKLVSSLLGPGPTVRTSSPVSDAKDSEDGSLSRNANGSDKSDVDDDRPPTLVDLDEASSADSRSTASQHVRVHEEALTVREWEVLYARRLHVFISTPRTAKRLTNVYRMVKARLRRPELEKFEGTKDAPGEFRVPMVLLALVLGAPEVARPLMTEIMARGTPKKATGQGVRALVNAMHDNADVERTKACLRELHRLFDDPAMPADLATFQRWIPRVARFSFDLGDMGALATPVIHS